MKRNYYRYRKEIIKKKNKKCARRAKGENQKFQEGKT